MNRLVSLVALSALALPAMAQGNDVKAVVKPIRVLAGIFNANKGSEKVGVNVGVSYDFMKSTSSMPAIYSVYVDYNERDDVSFGSTEGSQGERQGRDIDLGVERKLSRTGIGVAARFLTSSADDAAHAYYGAGIGSYSVKFRGTDSKIGGKIFGGYELNNGWFGELDYTLIPKINGIDVSGLGLRAGYRF